MGKVFLVGGTVAVVVVLLASAALAGFCAADSVVAGTVCIDKYEASVWRVPNPLGVNAGLVTKIQAGTATAADLTAAGATQLGMAGDNYAPCTANGQNCANDIYAVSLAGVTPAAYGTWFQAQEACANSGKRLPTSAEWQVAANGSPDPGGDNGTTDCNTESTLAVAATGSRSSCVSARGAFDMVGNLGEWVADWVPAASCQFFPSPSCPTWGAFSDDYMGLSGASTTATGPGALFRGGTFFAGPFSGPLAVTSEQLPSQAFGGAGFRCARPLSSACTDCTCDRNADRQVTVDELVDGVNNALSGCE